MYQIDQKIAVIRCRSLCNVRTHILFSTSITNNIMLTGVWAHSHQEYGQSYIVARLTYLYRERAPEAHLSDDNSPGLWRNIQSVRRENDPLLTETSQTVQSIQDSTVKQITALYSRIIYALLTSYGRVPSNRSIDTVTFDSDTSFLGFVMHPKSVTQCAHSLYTGVILRP